MIVLYLFSSFFFFFNDTATTEIYTLSLHDALPICSLGRPTWCSRITATSARSTRSCTVDPTDRKSTRLNSSHLVISYAVFCLKKKKNKTETLKRRTSTTHDREYSDPQCDEQHGRSG